MSDTPEESVEGAPGDLLRLDFSTSGKVPIRIDCGPYGVIHVWGSQDSPVSITLGERIPVIDYLDPLDPPLEWGSVPV